METRAFKPLYIQTTPLVGTSQTFGTLFPSVTVASTNSSATASTAFPGSNNNQFVQIQIANTTIAWAYVNFGVTGQLTAATVASSLPVAPGAIIVVSVDGEVTGASVILGTAPSTNTAVIFTRGEGL